MNDPYEVMDILAGELLRPMQKQARAEARERNSGCWRILLKAKRDAPTAVPNDHAITQSPS